MIYNTNVMLKVRKRNILLKQSVDSLAKKCYQESDNKNEYDYDDNVYYYFSLSSRHLCHTV